ncbi:iron complex outermembrane recepter protein [Reichenbachiella faecimaris]|uniref:Iron complex outermembrane recepter protein n=1 Tax=Reichenbachiella faecimaris TaxID=692418 RepID=A0A1W2GL28_REIFA|nr:TonB-dependent receptor [Reichenbachiella faecimaris]SMD37355.1 iron complex outermembrane recepter protein [Reichenbachiella faecimaris]
MNKLFFTLIFFYSSIALGQTFKGQVKNADTDEPIAYANVYIEETQSGTRTNESGYFKVDVSILTKMTLQISYMGYQTLVQHVDIENLENNLFLLEPSHLQLDEVVVAVPGGKLGSENVVSIEQQSMVDLNFSSPPTLAMAITQIPGVEQISTGSGIGKPVIRGLTGNRIVVYSQNTRLENQQFGGEHGLGENALGIERVEVVKGPASLLYGADALGGVLYLIDERYTQENRIEGFAASGYTSNTKGLKSSLGFKMNKNRIKWNLFGAYGNHADYQIPNDQRVVNTRFNDISIKSALGYHRKNWVGNIRYSFLKNNIGIPEEAAYTSEVEREMESPYQEIGQHIISFENTFYLGENEISAILGFTSNRRKEFEEHHEHEEEEEEEEHEEHEEGEVALEMLLNTFTYNLKSKFELSSHKTFLTTGLQGMYQTNENFGEEILIPDAHTFDLGIYSVINHSSANDFEWQGGLRFDIRKLDTETMSTHDGSIPEFNQTFAGFNGSFGVSKTWNQLTLKTNLSSGFRPPNTAELLSDGVHHGSLRYERGNRELNSERAVQADLTFELNSEHFHVGLSPFYNYINQYIYLQPGLQVIDDFPVFDYDQTNAKLYGGEISLHYHPHQIHWLHIESSWSSVTAEDENGDALPLIPANRLSSKVKAEFNQDGWIEFKNIFIEHVYKFDQDRVGLDETPTDSYGLLHAGINIEFPFQKGGLVWQIGVNNILDNEYIDHLSRLKSHGIYNPGRNFSFSLRWNWGG